MSQDTPENGDVFLTSYNAAYFMVKENGTGALNPIWFNYKNSLLILGTGKLHEGDKFVFNASELFKVLGEKIENAASDH